MVVTAEMNVSLARGSAVRYGAILESPNLMRVDTSFGNVLAGCARRWCRRSGVHRISAFCQLFTDVMPSGGVVRAPGYR